MKKKYLEQHNNQMVAQVYELLTYYKQNEMYNNWRVFFSNDGAREGVGQYKEIKMFKITEYKMQV